MPITIVVNGEAHITNDGQTLLGLLSELKIAPERVAIELDKRIVKQARWQETELRPGAHIEIVQFVGGG
jgi:thiamine biosynthesis protein ThiS